ncbi:hypothetical protein [Consotaella aegiceratis]|uniref:hypothetical protein n=1 Tax=Consotaella aegiceratis TaxID=3097961 RepID=UPI002F409586
MAWIFLSNLPTSSSLAEFRPLRQAAGQRRYMRMIIPSSGLVGAAICGCSRILFEDSV